MKCITVFQVELKDKNTRFLNYKKKLKLIDFGGSLGSFFFQNRSKIKAKLLSYAF